jgi:hypothetical protein
MVPEQPFFPTKGSMTEVTFGLSNRPKPFLFHPSEPVHFALFNYTLGDILTKTVIPTLTESNTVALTLGTEPIWTHPDTVIIVNGVKARLELDGSSFRLLPQP